MLITLTNLPGGSFDLYLYGFESSYEVTVGTTSSGIKSLPSYAPGNLWMEGLQYALFRGLQVVQGDPVLVRVKPGVGGYAVICGLQISGTSVAPPVTTNRPPVACSQTLTVTQGSPAAIMLRGIDPNGDSLLYAITRLPEHGTLKGLPPSLIYTPETGYAGTDAIGFIVADSSTISAEATVTLNVQSQLPGSLISINFYAHLSPGLNGVKTGAAAVGHSAADFWNSYSRDRQYGDWLDFGFVPNLMTVENGATGAGLIIANAPGAWANNSSDPMYKTYVYPLNGGTITATITNLPVGKYDVYVYGLDSTYELAVESIDCGAKALPAYSSANNGPWVEGLQYVLFRNVAVSGTGRLELTVRPGAGGYATISGMQLVGTGFGPKPSPSPMPEPPPPSLPQGALGAAGSTVPPETTAAILPPALPSLRIVSSESQITLVWPDWASGFVLQEAADFTGSGIWTTLSAPKTVKAGEIKVVLPIPASARFFRLAVP